jgi:hypothetical protein
MPVNDDNTSNVKICRAGCCIRIQHNTLSGSARSQAHIHGTRGIDAGVDGSIATKGGVSGQSAKVGMKGRGEEGEDGVDGGGSEAVGALMEECRRGGRGEDMSLPLAFSAPSCRAIA